MALAHGSAVTLWDTQSNLLVQALDATDARKVAFTSAEGRYLAAAGTQKGVTVWDILSCQVVHTHPAQAVDVLVPLKSGFIAAQSGPTSTSLALFTPDGTVERTVTLKTVFSALAALPSPAAHLVGIAPSGEIYRFGDMQAAAAPTARSVANAAAPERRAMSIWQEMFGKDAFLDDLEPEAAPPAAVSALQRRAAGHPAQVFDGPSHTLPPVGMLFDAFMDELLSAPREEPEESPEDGMEIDDVPALGAAPLPLSLAADSVRAVRDDEMDELEGFFATLLSSAPRKAPASNKSAANGHAKVKSTPVKTPRASIATSTPGHGQGDEPELVDRKGKNKKRKAPRTSEH